MFFSITQFEEIRNSIVGGDAKIELHSKLWLLLLLGALTAGAIKAQMDPRSIFGVVAYATGAVPQSEAAVVVSEHASLEEAYQ